MSTEISVVGASGRMGTAILRVIAEDPDCALGIACDRSDSLGADSLGAVFKAKPQAVIDFSSAAITARLAALAAQHRVPLVIGTTGLAADAKRAIEVAANSIPIVCSPNMSVGVNVLFRVVAEAARLLGEGYDLEVVEAHHRLKKDAPSGTAVRIGEILAAASGQCYPQDVVFAREGMIGERPNKKIGIQTVRGGDIVGEHTVMYCGLGERLEIKHIATSRETFARGAVRAAKWVAKEKNPGLYGMEAVLGLS